jgi:hypothetical protein
MNELSKRERLELSINFKEVDRIVVFDTLHQPDVIEYYTNKKLTYKNYESDLKIIGEATQKVIDLTCNFIAPLKVGRFKHDDGFIYLCDGWTTWLEKRPFDNTKELEEYIKRNIEEVNNYKQGEQWTFQGNTNASGVRFKNNYREDFLARQLLLGDTVLMHDESPVGLDTAWNRAGFINFVFLYQEKPQLISEWLEALLNHEIKRVKDVADYELSPIVLVYADIADKNNIFFTKDFLKKEFFSRLRRLVDAWHQYNIKCIYHSDGNLNIILDDLIATGIDGINPLEPDCNMFLKDIKKKYPKLILTGGVDAKRYLAAGTLDEIKQDVINCIKIAGLTGYLIGSSSEEILPSYKMDNVIRMLETVKRYKFNN